MVVTTTNTSPTGSQVFVFGANGSLWHPKGAPATSWPRYNRLSGADAKFNGAGNQGTAHTARTWLWGRSSRSSSPSTTTRSTSSTGDVGAGRAMVHQPRVRLRRSEARLGTVHPLGQPDRREQPVPPARRFVAKRAEDSLAPVDRVTAGRRRPRRRRKDDSVCPTSSAANRTSRRHTPSCFVRRQRRRALASRAARAPAARTTGPPAGRRWPHSGSVERSGGAAVALAVGLAGHLDPQVRVDERVAGRGGRRGAETAVGRVAPVLRVRVRPRPGTSTDPGRCGWCRRRSASVGTVPPSIDAYRESTPTTFSAGSRRVSLHSP